MLSFADAHIRRILIFFSFCCNLKSTIVPLKCFPHLSSGNIRAGENESLKSCFSPQATAGAAAMKGDPYSSTSLLLAWPFSVGFKIYPSRRSLHLYLLSKQGCACAAKVVVLYLMRTTVSWQMGWDGTCQTFSCWARIEVRFPHCGQQESSLHRVPELTICWATLPSNLG